MRSFLYCLLLVIAGFVIYYPTLFTNFVSDDLKQIVKNSAVNSLHNIPSLFSESITFEQNNKVIHNFYYKPIFYSLYAILYSAGNKKAFSFHLFQLILYLVNAVL